MGFRWLFFRYLPRDIKIRPSLRGEIGARAFSSRDEWPQQMTVWLLPITLVFGAHILFSEVDTGLPWVLDLVLIMIIAWLLTAITGRWLLAGRVIKTVQQFSREKCLACGYPRQGIEETSTYCPECGTRFGFESCIHCRQSLRGVADARFCPECGGDQHLPPPPPDLRWLLCQYVDGRLPLSRRELAAARRRGLASVSAGRHLLVIGGSILFLLALMRASLWMLQQPEALMAFSRTIVDVADVTIPTVVAALVVFWYLVLAWMMRLFYAPSVRAAVSDDGYDICLACGHWLGGETEFRHCTRCGRETRDHVPAPQATGAGTSVTPARPGTAR